MKTCPNKYGQNFKKNVKTDRHEGKSLCLWLVKDSKMASRLLVRPHWLWHNFSNFCQPNQTTYANISFFWNFTGFYFIFYAMTVNIDITEFKVRNHNFDVNYRRGAIKSFWIDFIFYVGPILKFKCWGSRFQK